MPGSGSGDRRLRGLARRPGPLLAGLAANLAVPIVFIAGVSRVMGLWHNPEEVRVILLGLALVISMPIAGSSTAWAQNSDGDVALSLGLVVASTCLSPIATPLALHAVGFLTSGGPAEEIHGLAARGTGGFLAAFVLLPALAGMVLRAVLGEARAARIRPPLKLAGSLNLLVLCFSNASAALPQAISRPDWDFLGAILIITVGLCGLAFGTGWLLGRLLGLEAPGRASLMYGLGMNNNGTGLVLASMALAGRPGVLLPIIVYNLVQQVVAGVVGARSKPRPKPQGEPSPSGAVLAIAR